MLFEQNVKFDLVARRRTREKSFKIFSDLGETWTSVTVRNMCLKKKHCQKQGIYYLNDITQLETECTQHWAALHLDLYCASFALTKCVLLLNIEILW